MMHTDVRPPAAADLSFTQLTVSTPMRAVDVAVPDDMSAAELLSALLAEVGSSGEPMVLDHPTKGVLPASATVGALGLMDGERLVMRSVRASEIVRPVDDVAEDVARSTDAAPAWTAPTGHRIFGVLLAAWALAGAWMSDIVRPVRMRPYVLAVVVLVLLFGHLMARRPGRETERDLLAVTFIGTGVFAAWVTSGLHLPQTTIRAVVSVLALVAAAGVIAVLDPRHALRFRAVLLSALPALVGLGLGWFATHLGRSAEEGAALVAAASAVGLGLVTRLATATSGLLALDTDSAEGRPVDSARLTLGAARAATDVTGLLAGLGVTGAAAAAVLAQGNRWAVLLCAVLVVILACRARSFARSIHVTVLVVAAVAAVGAGALWKAATAPSTPLALVVLIGAVPLALLTALEPRTLSEARFKLWLDRLEVVALVALVPLALAVFDAYAAVYARFH